MVESIKATGTGGANTVGVVMRRVVAELLEVDQVPGGKAFYNAAKKSQTASYSRLWGKDCALLHLNRNLVTANDAIPIFRFTAQWGSRMAGTYDDPSRSAHDSTVVKVVEQLHEPVPYQGAGAPRDRMNRRTLTGRITEDRIGRARQPFLGLQTGRRSRAGPP